MQALTHKTYHLQTFKHVALQSPEDLMAIRAEIRKFYGTCDVAACLPLQSAAFFAFEQNCKQALRNATNNTPQVSSTYTVTMPHGLKLVHGNGCVQMQQLGFTLPVHTTEELDEI